MGIERQGRDIPLQRLKNFDQGRLCCDQLAAFIH